jgi:hypothetical protein
LKPRSPTRPYIGDAGGLYFRIPTLVHHRSIVLDEFYLRLSHRGAIKNFSISFIMTYVEALDPIEGKLNVVVSE